MANLQYSVRINAPREKVWNTMLGSETYKEWTLPFNPAGSRFEGTWEKGGEILFLGVNEESGAEEVGMYAEIADSRPLELISIRHLGEIAQDGTKTPWADASIESYENYTFSDAEGGTEVQVDLIGLPDAWADMMNDAWPKALEKLKEISERA